MSPMGHRLAPGTLAPAAIPFGGAEPGRRFSTRRKVAAVTRLLRGTQLETLVRELNVTVTRLNE